MWGSLGLIGALDCGFGGEAGDWFLFDGSLGWRTRSSG